ncbi:hypothetical protein EJ06DRAFT_516764 [Trichodelitschia bisporula]|uniref:Alpha/beta-hydrolase n=1 Tax=Trichodelitschia bisporula TaxID=703511 RepID=A0A6G1HJA3_9PEZI|nr:hypothetical protein EJ06DRAFT_516764 [Trichodelitschia bisporula]
MFTQPNATPQTYEKVDGTYGTGKYKPAWYTTDASLPDHTLYLPKTIPAGVKLPVVLWANGGCGGNGVAWLSPLVEWASHGMLVIADGAPNGRSRDTAALMKKALDWVNANAGKGAYAQVDGKRVGISGQSCGGLVAYEVEGDKRVTAVGIFNSGALNAAQRQVVPKFSKPIAYFLGGKTDIAYAQGTADYNALPKGLPAWKGNVESGHGGTFCRPAGGEYGKAGSQWWKWQLRGDPSAKAFFTEPGAKDMGWQAVSQNLDKAPVPEALPGN